MPKDFLQDENGDLLIENGDFVIGESTRQHQKALLVSTAGNYRQNPEIGVGLVDYLNDENDLSGLRAKIISEFENDGMDVRDVQIIGGEIIPDANYRNG